MFISFANFYQCFIQGFSKIAIWFTSLLKTIRLLDLTLKAFKADDNKIVGNSGNKANEKVLNLFKNNKSRNSMYIPNIRDIKNFTFLTPNAKKAFNHF